MKTRILLIGLMLISMVDAYTIDGKSVYFENSYGRITQYPHTLKAFTDFVYLNFSSSIGITSCYDITMGFDTETVKPLEVYLKVGDSWTDIKQKFSVSHYDLFNKNTWYYINDVNFNPYESKLIKVKLGTTPTTERIDGKYDILIKKCEDTLQQAIDTNRFVHLDPWFNISYTNRIEINCSNYIDRIPLIVNGSGGFDLDNSCPQAQIVWTYCSGNTSIYYNNCTDYVIANYTDRLPTDIEKGNGVSYLRSNVYPEEYIGVWHLNNNSEYTGNFPNGAVTGALPNANGRIDGQYAFDGDADYINVSDGVITPQVSVMFWVKRTGAVDALNAHYIFDTGFGLNFGGFTPYYRKSTGTYAISFGDGTVNCDRDLTLPFNLNEQQFVTYVYNSSGQTELYLNGSHVKSDSCGDGTLSDNAGHWFIGSDFNTPTSREFTGQIDELRIINYSMTETEIDRIYYNMLGISGYGVLGTGEQIEFNPPNITLISPLNNSNTTALNMTFISHVIDDTGINNVSLYLNGTLNQTNTSGINDFNYSFFVDGLDMNTTWCWYIRACDNMTEISSNCNSSGINCFNVGEPPPTTTTTTTSTTTTTIENITYNDTGIFRIVIIDDKNLFNEDTKIFIYQNSNNVSRFIKKIVFDNETTLSGNVSYVLVIKEGRLINTIQNVGNVENSFLFYLVVIIVIILILWGIIYYFKR